MDCCGTRQQILRWNGKGRQKDGKSDKTGGSSAVDHRDAVDDSVRAGGDSVCEALYSEKTEEDPAEVKGKTGGSEVIGRKTMISLPFFVLGACDKNTQNVKNADCVSAQKQV